MPKVLFVHAHQDDYEFTAGGSFEIWRGQLGKEFHARVLICTDGSAGHHSRTRKELIQIRAAEQAASAQLGGYDYQQLRLPDGSLPREACLQVTIPLLAALWKAIRDFEPDYLFCPPWVSDPLAGIHNDHQTIADAVRRVAYMINVPHAFIAEYPADETRSELRKTPVILHVYDGYQFGANSFDLATDAEAAFDLNRHMTWCHQSQICEWLPWVGRHRMNVPANLEEWTTILRKRYQRRNRELGIDAPGLIETFTVTAWGEIPTVEQLRRDLPGWHQKYSRWEALEHRLALYRGEA
ncbi:MAG: PIG-L family deacetylase [Verrucomicrobia bacterium]|nr:PIG-L family deacetylase [Verrucomicrobiota bacterium]